MNYMAEMEFEPVFALPEGEHDEFEIADAVLKAGFEDAIVGTAVPGMIGVELEVANDHVEEATLDAARAMQKSFRQALCCAKEVRLDL